MAWRPRSRDRLWGSIRKHSSLAVRPVRSKAELLTSRSNLHIYGDEFCPDKSLRRTGTSFPNAATAQTFTLFLRWPSDLLSILLRFNTNCPLFREKKKIQFALEGWRCVATKKMSEEGYVTIFARIPNNGSLKHSLCVSTFIRKSLQHTEQ